MAADAIGRIAKFDRSIVEINCCEGGDITILMAEIALAGLGLGMWSLGTGCDIDRAAPACIVRISGIVMAVDTVTGIDRPEMLVRVC